MVLNEEPFIVVGVLPPDFQFLNADASFWAPSGVTPAYLTYRGSHSMRVLARVKPGVTETQAQAETAARMRKIARDVPGEADDLGAFVQPLLYLLGMDHKKLTYRFQGRDIRLTDVYGTPIPQIVA